MSLWKVDDAATRELMGAYYDGLLGGGGRNEALRQVQLAMLRRPGREHPYYWASFIVSGNPAALDGKPVTPDFAKVPPGMRGCGCHVGSNAPASAGTSAIALVALAGVRLRSRRRWRPSRQTEWLSVPGSRARATGALAEAGGMASTFCEDLAEG